MRVKPVGRRQHLQRVDALLLPHRGDRLKAGKLQNVADDRSTLALDEVPQKLVHRGRLGNVVLGMSSVGRDHPTIRVGEVNLLDPEAHARTVCNFYTVTLL